MNKSLIFVFILFFQFSASGQVEVSDHLEDLKPFAGKIWKGEFSNSTTKKPVFDIAKWEYALNGKAVRILHSVNDGAYGGETIIFWNKETESVEFYYFTTEGFYTKGKVTLENGILITHEKVTGNKDGITEVKSISKILPDGRMQNKSQMKKNGEWEEGFEIIYYEDPQAKVIFKDIKD